MKEMWNSSIILGIVSFYISFLIAFFSSLFYIFFVIALVSFKMCDENFIVNCNILKSRRNIAIKAEIIIF